MILVERELLIIPPRGTNTPFHVESGNRGRYAKLIIQVPEGDYPGSCLIQVQGIWEPINVHGVDRWQSLFLAIRLMNKQLKQLADAGFTFELYEEGCEADDYEPGETISAESIFEVTDNRTA